MGNYVSLTHTARRDYTGHATSPTNISPSITTLDQSETLPLLANRQDTQTTATDATHPTVNTPRRSIMLPSTTPKYDVFVSHAGEDKVTIAVPLREMLIKHGITVFVDEMDIEPGADAHSAIIDAMETAKVGVVVLSPEFVARKWPIKELMCFLRRVEESTAEYRNAPKIIPVFYRLTIGDLYREPRLDRRDKDGNRLYQESRFFERMKKGEPEASISNIECSLRKLDGFMGVRNDFDASNDSTALMGKRREKIVENLFIKIRQAIYADPQHILRAVDEDTRARQSQGTVDVFRTFFPPFSHGVEAVLDFNDRTRLEGYTRQLLLDEPSLSSRIFSILGMGGVGKSTIVRALSFDYEFRQRFPDGVHLMKLGKDATSITLLHQICQVLNDSGAQKAFRELRVRNNVYEAMHFFERWFDGKRCAFLIDDAWQSGVGHNLISRLYEIGIRVSGDSVLITTRDPEIAPLAPSERIIRIAPREARGVVSRQILSFHAGCPETDLYTASGDESINKILDICAGLPLVLAIVGKNVKQMRLGMLSDKGKVWGQYLSHLLVSRDNLLRTDALTSRESYSNLFATIASSISLLDAKLREETLGFECPLSFAKMYRRLCVLQRQTAVPSSMLKHLWKVESGQYASVIARVFVKMGLASHEAVRVDGESMWYLSQHDSLHDFAVVDAERNGDTKESHECLLNGYKSCDPDISFKVNGTSNWWSHKLEEDGYIHRNLCRHLLGAGCAAELVELLLCPQWAERQVLVNGIAFLEADLVLGVAAIQDGMTDACDQAGFEVRTALELISEAVALSSGFIGSNVAELHFQVHGRLKEFMGSFQAIYKYLNLIESDTRRPKILCDNSFLGTPGGMNTRIIPIGVPVTCMAVMKGGERIACGCDDGRIFVVDAKRWVVEKHWKAHGSALNAIVFSKTSTRLVSGSDDRTAVVWDVNSSGCVTTFTGHSDAVYDMSVMGDGKRVISVAADGSAFVWNMETGQILSTVFATVLKGRRAIRCVTMLTILGDEEVAVTGGDYKKLRMWNVEANEQADDPFDGHKGPVMCVVVTPDGKRLVSGSSDDTVRVWDVGSHQQIGNSFEGHSDSVQCVAVSEDGRRIVSGSWDGTIRVWNLESWTQICDPLEAHTNVVTGVSFLAGANRIVSCSLDETVRVWDMTRATNKRLKNQHERKVSGVSFTPDGNFVVSSSYDGTLRIWHTASGQQVGDPLRGPGHQEWIRDVAVTSNGKFILSVSDDQTLCVWALESHQLLHTFGGHTDVVECVAATPKGDRAVTGSRDKTVRVWDLAAMDGSHFVLEGHNDVVKRVFVSDDGKRVISVDYEDKVFVWELEARVLDKQHKEENARNLSRRDVLSIADERTIYDDTPLSVPLGGRQIIYGEEAVLATMETTIQSWALSPSGKTICVGLMDGQVAFLNLLR